MVKEAVGVIFGETGSHEFKFAVSDPNAARRGDYVKVWHDADGWSLAHVVSVTKSSDVLSLDKAMSVAYGEKVSDTGEKVVAKAVVIGSKDEQGLLRTPRTPFSPGERVFKADYKLIRGVLGLDIGDAYVGVLDGTNVKAHLDVNKLVSNHCSILAKTGSGKSYTAGVIIEELLEKDVPLLIIDPHGEYSSLKEPNTDPKAVEMMERYGISPEGYGSKIVTYTPSNLAMNPDADQVFRLDSVNISAKLLAELLPVDLTSTQMGILHRAVKKIRSKRDFYTVDDVVEEVSQDASSGKWNVLDAIESLRNTGILSDSPTVIDDLMQRGKASIIDMQGVDPELQDIIVARICETLFEARKINRVPPGMLVVEEAHEFCPEKGYLKSVSSSILRTIASEGRKFGLGLMVISQRPARVDKNVLSQCHTQIILKVTNSNDLRALSKSLEGISPEMEEEIKRLPPGVALTVSGDIERPVMVDVRVRRTMHGGSSIKILEDDEYVDQMDDGRFVDKVFRRKV